MGQTTAVETGRATEAYFDELHRTWELPLLRRVVGTVLSTRIEQINLYGVPGRWGRADALGRGRLPPEPGPW